MKLSEKVVGRVVVAVCGVSTLINKKNLISLELNIGKLLLRISLTDMRSMCYSDSSVRVKGTDHHKIRATGKEDQCKY